MATTGDRAFVPTPVDARRIRAPLGSSSARRPWAIGIAAAVLLLTNADRAGASNIYFDLAVPADFAGATGVPYFIIDLIGLGAPPYLPSTHEAFIYRAVSSACGRGGVPDHDPAECAFYLTEWNDTADSWYPYWEVCTAADGATMQPECMEIGWESSGDGGFEHYDFLSLLLGARFVDLREMSPLEGQAPVFEGLAEYLTWNLSGHRPWPATLGTADLFPAQHAYASCSFIENNRIFGTPWREVEGVHDQPVAGVVERNQAVLTAAAAFLVDRFFQAQPGVVPSDPLPVVDFSTIRQALAPYWRAGLYLTGLVTELSSPCYGSLLLAAANDWVSNPDSDRRLAELGITAAAAFCLDPVAAPQYGFAMDLLENVDPGEHEAARADLFYIGQATHTIADSFAHTIRSYWSVDSAGTRYANIPMGSVRTDDPEDDTCGGWFYNHSGAVDHNGEYTYLYSGGDADYFMFDDSASVGDQLFMEDQGNALGKANIGFGSAAVREWFRIFYEPPSPGETEFDSRYAALGRLIRTHFAYNVPQELSPGEIGRYRETERCRSTGDCSDAFAMPGGGTDAGECDFASGICRRPCSGDEDCAPGFACASGVAWDGGVPTTAHRFCSARWDPWATVGDEYFVGVQRDVERGGRGDYGGRSWLPRLGSLAREWYMFDRGEPPYVADKAILAFDSLEGARADCLAEAAAEGKDLVAILFEGRRYTGTHYCVTRGPVGNHELTEVASPVTSMVSAYVEPGRRICLESCTGAGAGYLCLFGGLNGSGESLLMEQWRRIGRIAWNDPDIDGDGVLELDDNCMLTYNPDQYDLDGDGFGDACDRDVDGDLVLEDGDGYWGLGDGVEEPCRLGGPVRGQACDDNCPRTYNPARLDLAPIGTPTEPAGDGVPDQFDLDGDGLGDACDPDPDGDGTHLLYPTDRDYGDLDEAQGHPRPGVTVASSIVGECAEFLWFLTEDKDDDLICDLYNFIPDGNVPPPWVPDPRYYGWPYPNVGYLKPAGMPATVDIMNAHYLSSCYITAHK